MENIKSYILERIELCNNYKNEMDKIYYGLPDVMNKTLSELNDINNLGLPYYQKYIKNITSIKFTITNEVASFSSSLTMRKHILTYNYKEDDITMVSTSNEAGLIDFVLHINGKHFGLNHKDSDSNHGEIFFNKFQEIQKHMSVNKTIKKFKNIMGKNTSKIKKNMKSWQSKIDKIIDNELSDEFYNEFHMCHKDMDVCCLDFAIVFIIINYFLMYTDQEHIYIGC